MPPPASQIRAGSLIVPYSGKGIQLAFERIADNVLDPIANLGTAPTWTLNGVGQGSLSNPQTSSTSKTTLTLPFNPPQGGSGLGCPYVYYPLAQTLLSTDVVTLTWASDSFTCWAGSVAAQTGAAVVNNVGNQIIPKWNTGVPTFLRAGQNVSFNNNGNPGFIYANLAKRGEVWSGNPTLDGNNYPTSVGTYTSLLAQAHDNDIGYADVPTGVYKVLWDGANVTYDLTSNQATITPGASSTGNATGNYAYFTVSYTYPGSGKFWFQLGLRATVTGTNSNNNVRVYPPGIAQDDSVKWSPWFLAQVQGCQALRTMDFMRTNTLTSNGKMGCEQNIGDYCPAGSISYNGAGSVTLASGTITAVDNWNDPQNVYSGAGSNIVKLKLTINNHGLTTGQTFNVASGAPVITLDDNSTISMSAHVFPPCYVIDSNTVACYHGTTTPGRSVANAPVAYNSGMSLVMQGTPQWADLPSLFNAAGADGWINLPMLCSDALADAIGHYFFDPGGLNPGRVLYVEFGNEHWNTTFGMYTWLIIQAKLGGYANYHQYYCFQANHLFQRIKTIATAAGRGGDVRLILGSQASVVGAGGVTDLMASYCAANNINPYGFAIAPYWDNGAFTGLDQDQHHDLSELFLQYAQVFKGTSQYANQSGLTQYNMLQDHQLRIANAGLSAKLVCYEGGPQQTSQTISANESQFSRYWSKDPRMYKLYLWYLTQLQMAGIPLAMNYTSNYSYQGDATNPDQAWCTHDNFSSTRSYADGSDGKYDNRLSFTPAGTPEDPTKRAQRGGPIAQSIWDWNAPQFGSWPWRWKRRRPVKPLLIPRGRDRRAWQSAQVLWASAQAAAPVGARHLLGAIKNYWAASNLSGPIGPLYAERAAAGLGLPWVVVETLSGTPRYTFTKAIDSRRVVQFTIESTGEWDAQQRGELLRDQLDSLLGMAPNVGLTMNPAVVTGFQRIMGPQTRRMESKVKAGTYVYACTLQYRAYIERVHA